MMFIPAKEYKALLSNYAAYKHNKDKYPTTRFGEAVIASQDYPGTIMYVKGSISNPEITKITKIDESIPESLQYQIQEEVLKYERKQVSFSWGAVEAIFGEGLFTNIRKRDFPSFQELKRRRKGESGQGDSSDNRIKQNRERSSRESKIANEEEADNLKSPDEKVKAFFYK